ncbi:ribosome maturation factor RimM [Sphingomonas swuensis]|uniref:Ribosome maturation factor RimM n=1 Tax=Sphingomonas swuensis TaxID=977800 RepID=A0ABP7SW17_9SPHN
MARRSPSGELPAPSAEGFSDKRGNPSGPSSPGDLPRGGGSRVSLAAVAGAHGVRGEVRLKLFADGLDSLSAHKQVLVDGTPRRLLAVGGTPKSPTARLEGVSDRNAAEALRGTLIEVERDALPPLDDGEYYHADLVGLPCTDGQGVLLGSVHSVENYGAGDLLDVELANGKRSLIPFAPGIADLTDGNIVLDPAFLA